MAVLSEEEVKMMSFYDPSGPHDVDTVNWDSVEAIRSSHEELRRMVRELRQAYYDDSWSETCYCVECDVCKGHTADCKRGMLLGQAKDV